MQSYFMRFFKNIAGIYLCAVCCLSYATMIDAVPDHVYLCEGDALSLDSKLPVALKMSDSRQSVMADIGHNTYETLKREQTGTACESLSEGEYTLDCCLFGIFPIKEVQLSVVDGKQLYVSGHVVGIYGASQGVLVLGSSPVEADDGSYQEPAEHVLFSGDYITAVNGEKIQKKEELIEAVNHFGSAPMILTLWRGSEQIDVSVSAVSAADGGYMLGLWVKDDMAGIGTLTYYDDEGNFGALGHGIGDGQTRDLLRLSNGRLYRARVVDIKKGKRGDPGEIQGIVYYGEKNRIGQVACNTKIGIYGKLDENFLSERNGQDMLYPLAYKQEIKQGQAFVLSDVSGTPQFYRIEIDDIDYSPADTNKGIHFHVVDENLLSLTGGIVQGLSGSPIVQDGKIIGAVTHVLVNDPAKGYGIFIENMVEH